MAALQLSLQNFLSTPTAGFGFRPWKSGGLTVTGLPPRLLKSRTIDFKPDARNSKWAVRLSLVDQSPPKSAVDVDRLVDFLFEDLRHLFDEQGIDRTAYDEHVRFRDPITKHDTISGYLFNISLLRELFRPEFFLHWVKQVWFTSISLVLRSIFHYSLVLFRSSMKSAVNLMLVLLVELMVSGLKLGFNALDSELSQIQRWPRVET